MIIPNLLIMFNGYNRSNRKTDDHLYLTPAQCGAGTLEMGSAWAPASRLERSSLRANGSWVNGKHWGTRHSWDLDDSFSKTFSNLNCEFLWVQVFCSTCFTNRFHSTAQKPGPGNTGDPRDYRW